VIHEDVRRFSDFCRQPKNHFSEAKTQISGASEEFAGCLANFDRSSRLI